MKNKVNKSYQMLVSPKEEEVFHQVESDEYLGSKVLGKNATVLEKIKYELCQSIVRYKRKEQLELKSVARLLKLDELTANKLLHYHIENFALDSLVSYVEKLNIPCQVKITSEENYIPPRKSSDGRLRKHL
jgi:predicted XRE-type DNA-binding protein